ncbi:unnamed protein product [Gongylonema pulchrum]|uniref:Uncharacterized protein n=1 Tax=Gongylonema pulchrum TaxID=637853 RepID=A0A183CYU5_9BILA|nr:unnamed protein product [Gongylonema pulchrum]
MRGRRYERDASCGREPRRMPQARAVDGLQSFHLRPKSTPIEKFEEATVHLPPPPSTTINRTADNGKTKQINISV